MPVSPVGYINRLKLLPLPFGAKRYGPPNPNRGLLTIFMVCACLPVGRGGLTAMDNYLDFGFFPLGSRRPPMTIGASIFIKASDIS